jgi:NAD(P)-dependent dehydrogenase (short-subunit alcohol dehydrogenase family)
MHDFHGRVTVITGGASGVGRAIGARLVREGAHVVLADIDHDRLDTTVAEIGAAAGLTVDVTKEASVEALADQVFDRFGTVHLLFNNAGVGLGEAQRAIWTLPMNDWRWGFDVNVLGVVHGIRAFVPRMLERGEDGVVGVAALLRNSASLAAERLTQSNATPLYRSADLTFSE